MLSRRNFLKHSTVLALAPTVPRFLAQTARAAKPEKDSRILVVVQLDGGNDGINTVVPFADEGYARHRRVLRLPLAGLVKVNDTIGLHPSLGDAGKLLESHRLAIIQGVGYPNPNRSHFESIAIWQSARLDPEERCSFGWLGRALDLGQRAPGVPDAVAVGSGTLPLALRGRHTVASSLTRPEDFILSPESARRPITSSEPNEDLAAYVLRSALDAYATADRMADVARSADKSSPYPSTQLASELRLMARLMKLDLGTRVYYARQSGYDTHAVQFGTHGNLLSELAGALRAFLDDLAAARLAERVAVLVFSEFGRTVTENASAGTDHGTAGPVFLAGPRVQSGLIGTAPSLMDLDPRHGDLRVGTDFRRIYATLLEEWLGLPSHSILGGPFERLELFRT
ncbi:MAG TPA: DUF1501 domain-containing protein [Gemmataceae bacterium]|nr:DUF1501 domain-containing protein [Gemmataceae bacterium]